MKFTNKKDLDETPDFSGFWIEEKTLEFRPIDGLTKHPLHLQIYEEVCDSDFVEDVRKNGIRTPLLITPKGIVVSGWRRLSAAKLVGLDVVPVQIHLNNDARITALRLLESNIGRAKPMAERLREFVAFRRVIAELLETEIAGRPALKLTPAQPAKLAACKCALTPQDAETGVQVLDAMRRAREVGDTTLAEEIERLLEVEGIGAAHTFAAERRLFSGTRQRKGGGKMARHRFDPACRNPTA